MTMPGDERAAGKPNRCKCCDHVIPGALLDFCCYWCSYRFKNIRACAIKDANAAFDKFKHELDALP